MSTNTPDPRYSDAEIAALWRALRERRDMRHFVPAAEAEPLPEGLLERLIEAAHLAPSVGYMQPWRFLRITDARLREVHFGEYEGLTWEEMSEPQQQALQEWLANPFARPIPGPGGESLEQVAERLQAWSDELPSQGRVAVFTHGGVIRCNLWTSGGDGNPWKVQIGNGSTTAIRYGERSEVLWINDLSFR